ncbi:unnamed protein product [Adineta steineri]|uniref:TIR domain-containing protein n=1 Tax=Adineta steineri TaxID=433720 RepID=A0A815F1X3_9BILA|nr:unnamed protein product [Adineta steineri]CAF1584219.1 unnamed protein product [Adineta steineri]
MIRHEQKKKQEEKERSTNDPLMTIEQWNDSVPFDLLMCYSNNVNDTIMSLKIADRLTKKNYRVYIEKQSQHRLELMEIGASKQVPILACLSSTFRISQFCMAEVDYAKKSKCPIIPIIVEENYTIKGWLNHIIDNQTPIKLHNKTFNKSFMFLLQEIHQIIHSDERE